MSEKKDICSSIKFFIGLCLVLLVVFSFCIFGSFCCSYSSSRQNDNINITVTKIIDDSENTGVKITANKNISFNIKYGQSEETGGEFPIYSLDVKSSSMLCFMAKVVCYITFTIFLLFAFKFAFSYEAKINHNELSYYKTIEALNQQNKPSYTETKNVNLTIKEEGSTKAN